MILQALNEYYERKSGSGELAPPGFQWREIPFLVVLTESGGFLQLDDTRAPQGGRLVAKSFLVPQERERSGSRSFEIANTLWDHYGYVLGYPKTDSAKDVEMARKQSISFLNRARHISTAAPEDRDTKAVVAFLESNGERSRALSDSKWPECAQIPGCILSFRIAGRSDLVCQGQAIKTFLEHDQENADGDGEDVLPEIDGVCLVTGSYGRLTRKHPRTPILGVKPSSKSNAKLVSFQKNSGFDSYGRLQSYNAPVSEQAAFAYTTALNHLLRKGSRQRIQVGDASTVFWSADKSDFENAFPDLFGADDKDDPDRGIEAYRNLIESTKNGVYSGWDARMKFHVLGLAPNAARIAVRFWQTGRVEDFALHIRKHFDDIAIDAPTWDKPYLPLFRLLLSTALLAKAENIAPDLAGDTMRAILAGLPYPSMLLQAAIRRIRAEREVTYPRAAILKASLNRQRRLRPQSLSAKEIAMSLDKSNTDPGYRLGRLFAALERIQGAAQPGINATIRDRYYGAASSSPASVFPVLIKLKNHHLGKLDSPALVTWFEKVLGEIFDGIASIPSRLSLNEQALFAIGYYHQQQDFFKKKADGTIAVAETNDQGDK